LSIVQAGPVTAVLSNLTLFGTATVPGATVSFVPTNTVLPLMNCGTLTLNGTNSVSLAAVSLGTFPLIQYAGALAGSGNVTNLILPQGATGFLSNNVANSTLYAVITSTGPGLVWTGTNATALNAWNIGSTTNWLVNGTPTSYHQLISPGDSVIFNDVGSGTVSLNTNVAPTSILISNVSKSYTFGGAGTISGPSGLLKLGSGTAIVNLTNNSYLGNTIVSNGTVQLGAAAAISPTANLIVGGSGTVQLSGISQTFGELTGAGILDNNSGNNSILTVGSSSGGTWSGTIQDHNAGAVALHRVGTGTWVVSGSNYLNDGQPFSDLSQISSGTTIITNGGLMSAAFTQFQIAGAAGQTGTVVVAGGTLAVSNNVLAIGVSNAAANGTLIVNSGTVFHGGTAAAAFAPEANSIDVGAQGATGTLIVNGGQVLNNQVLFLGDGTGASGIARLNGGLLQASVVQPNGIPATSTIYFNGGTLQAASNSTDFILSTPMVQNGGAVIDDGGFAISIATQSLQEDPSSTGGGLTKKGSGTLYLDSGNSYTGGTLVTNGTLAGMGGVNSPVVVAPLGNLGAGEAANIGVFAINNTLTIRGSATMRINKNGGSPTSDLVTGITTASYGGALVVTNTTSDSTALVAGDTFTLFTAAASSGNFSSIVGSPGTGLAYSFNPANGVLSVVTVAPNPTNITFSVTGSTLMLSWPGDHLGWYAQSNSVNVVNGAAWFDIPGSQSVTNLNLSISPAQPQVFFRLRHP
jgi:autotransporter-associated beta strand protein